MLYRGRMLLVAVFPQAFNFVHAPFAYNPQFPWEVVDPTLFKGAWISLGVAILFFLFDCTPYVRVGEDALSASSPDNVEGDAGVAEKSRLYRITYAMIVILLFPNLAYGALWAWNRITVSSKPSIIWIMCDSLRADHLGCYGYPRNTSPNIDRFAKDGTLFNRAIAQASITRLSLPSFLTSMYPQTIKEKMPLPELLADRGYDTAAVVANPECEVTGTGAISVIRQFHTLDDGPCKSH